MAERKHGTSEIVPVSSMMKSLTKHETSSGLNSSHWHREHYQQYSTVASESTNIDEMPRVGTIEATKACALRLENILKREKEGSLQPQELYVNLEYAVTVLNAIFLEETSELCEEEELTEVSPSAVPKEVKEWLTCTFTRSRSVISENAQYDRLKFRSVATAIRAGIVVDRMYRKLPTSIGLDIPAEAQMQLKATIDQWSFDPFEIQSSSCKDYEALKLVAVTLFHRYEVINKFKINLHSLDMFLSHMAQGYSKYNNPYHNRMHAADVMQNCHMIMTLGRLPVCLTDVEIFALVFAALIHDFEHTGTNNAFHVNSGSRLAMMYNDRGVLENHHVSAVFQYMTDFPEANILRNMDLATFRVFRSLVIEMVLNTDMSLHFQQLKTIRSLLSMSESIEKSKILSVVLHAADLSHPTKSWKIHERWSLCLCEEFFLQGDREKAAGLTVSPMCDRHNCNLAQGQIGFINVIVQPTFELLGDLMDRIVESLCDCKETSTTQTNESSLDDNNLTLPQQTSTSEELFAGRVERPWDANFITNKANWLDYIPEES